MTAPLPVPIGWSVADWKAAQRNPARHRELVDAAAESCAVHVRAMRLLVS